MDYLTANEIAKQWNVSSRMVAYCCKVGKVEGAIMKGKTWLIPAHAKKPSDRRYRKNRMMVQDNPELQGALQSINRLDSENSTVYRARDLYQNLGLTRETLRYYEEVGLIAPGRNQNSQYREFTFDDVARLMSIDFYKKRGFSPLKIRELIEAEKHRDLELLDQKISDIKETIRAGQRILRRLAETKAFCEYAAQSKKVFSVKELPPYWVLETFDAVSSLNEYQERILGSLDLQEEDILSNLVRVVTFDSAGYKGTKMCLVSKAPNGKEAAGRLSLESGRCLHTVFDADSHDDSLMEKMFFESHQWATEHQKHFVGVVYIFIRFVELSELKERNFYEVWIPLK